MPIKVTLEQLNDYCYNHVLIYILSEGGLGEKENSSSNYINARLIDFINRVNDEFAHNNLK